MTLGDSAVGLRCSQLEKRFGNLVALRRVDLEIAPGETVVLAGHNGAGKSTLLRLAAGLTRPTSGRVFIGTAEVREPGSARAVGFLAHQTMLYDELTAKENLVLFAKLLGVPEPVRRAENLLAEAGLGERGDSLVRTFSRGMRQRLALARALLSRPRVLLLDEPGTGLDAGGLAWVAGTLHELHRDGVTTVMSLHSQPELAAVATRAVRLQAGKVAADSAAGQALDAVLGMGAC
ncbi:MAG TPA: heme ABC exporter ATP-binding protein CcmA [Methylomirabilota bacterium]|nr:heme ABC exporter ATP-binding protein CcmA [Methylomirabilota bacterium]